MSSKGFTLLELLVVITIASIVMGIGIPGLRELFTNAARREAATGLYSSFNRARAEAIARNTTVSVCSRDLTVSTPGCASQTNWLNGWMVYSTASDGSVQPIEVQKPVSGGLRFQTAPSSQVSFDSSGRVTSTTSFRLCARTGARDQHSRLIQIRRSGGVSLSEASTCS